MTPKTAIDIVVRSRDGTDPAAAANANRRIDLLDYLNHLTAFVHNYREWSWTWSGATTVTVLANARTVAVPADFQEFGQNGGLFNASTKTRLKEISPYLLDRIRLEGNAGSNLNVFCVRRELIELPFVVTSNLVLTPIYRVAPEVFSDHNSGATMLIPDRYCRTVIVPGLTRAGQQSKDDARPDWASELRDGLSQMCAQDNPGKTTLRRWPISIPGSW